MLKDRLTDVRTRIDGLQILAGAPTTGTIAVPVTLLDAVSEALAEAVHDIETRRSMIDETVRAVRGKDVAVKPYEMRALSEASVDLRNGLTAMPDDTVGRELVIKAAETIHDVLGAVVNRDRSWT